MWEVPPATLKRIYSKARQRGRGYVLVALSGGAPVVEARLPRGRVSSLKVSTAGVE